ncbi:hypothetical protein V1511DRAFT_497064 [Dipodascopsis uninucleata]
MGSHKESGKSNLSTMFGDDDEEEIRQMNRLLDESRRAKPMYKPSSLLSFLSSRNNPSNLKPNTNFLTRIVKSADSHNNALRLQEEKKSSNRLRQLDEATSSSTRHEVRPKREERPRSKVKIGPTRADFQISRERKRRHEDELNTSGYHKYHKVNVDSSNNEGKSHSIESDNRDGSIDLPDLNRERLQRDSKVESSAEQEGDDRRHNLHHYHQRSQCYRRHEHSDNRRDARSDHSSLKSSDNDCRTKSSHSGRSHRRAHDFSREDKNRPKRDP